MISQPYKPEDLNLKSQADWQPYPRANEREVWESLSSVIKNSLIALGENALNYQWKPLLATQFLAYIRTGSLSDHNQDFFERRQQVIALAMAECVEASGRFIDQLVDGIWLICEETYWGVPTHLTMQKLGRGLPDVTEPTVDLFAAETGMMLAYVDYLLAPQLDAVSPFIRLRIAHEIQRRILIPNFERDDFHWMGLEETSLWRNNWTPWICSNWLACVLLVEKNAERRAQTVHKIMRSLDTYLDPFPSDGGCDEGPNYWTRAAASVFDCLDLLQQATNGQVDFFDHQLIYDMGQFIYHAHIDEDYYINYADASAVVKPDAVLVYHYGQLTRNSTLMDFGAYLAKDLLDEATVTANLRDYIKAPLRGLRAIFMAEKLHESTGYAPQAQDVFLPVIQMFVARDAAQSATGFYVTAKGGYNNESHNHNDIGNFIVYRDGLPVIIDVGVESYTLKTFSDERYMIWTMQSAYHNLPTIDGVMQANGNQYRAKNVSHQANDDMAEFSLDIAGAYPDEVGLQVWQRTIRLQRGQFIEIEDTYELDHIPQSLSLSLMTVCHPTLDENGCISLSPLDLIDGRKSGSVKIYYAVDKFTVSIETITTSDPRLMRDWGTQIYQIVLTAINPLQSDTYLLKIESPET